ncbi:MAG: polyphosphate kinase 2 family protein [Burkholderiaceae bacterium]|nr:polyphosphate kinase 2 family protein [Burkholderiaceae bacterium]
MSLRATLRVNPGSKFRFKNFDPGFHGHHESEQAAKAELQHNLARISDLQRKLYGSRTRSLLIVLQGIDGAGKDGTCWHVISAMDPQGVSVHGFKQPTPEEAEHDFLWRVHPHAPGRGQVSIFNRSHYEDVMVVRVHKLVPKSTWQQRFDFINDWERLLTQQNDTVVLKFFLAISKDEQLARFKARLDDPARQWKISASDYTERDRWDDYTVAYEDALNRCSTKESPWYVIPANEKWFRNLAVSQIIADTLEDMHLGLPAPTVDLTEIRRRYHAEAKAEAAEDKRDKKIDKKSDKKIDKKIDKKSDKKSQKRSGTPAG